MADDIEIVVGSLITLGYIMQLRGCEFITEEDNTTPW